MDKTDDRKINFWHSANESDTAIVLIHGIFSDGRSCWNHLDASGRNSVYWPDLIASDPRFKRPSIFIAGYYTAPDSGEFSMAHCAKQVFAALAREDIDGTPAVLTKRRIAFVCHSTGGIVARYLIDRHRAAFRDMALGLALIASPSAGSAWANIVGLAAKYYNQRLARQLQVGNETLDDLHGRFRDLVNARATELPGLFGMEACEHHMVGREWIPRWLAWAVPPRLKVVSTRSAGQYFGDVTVLPGTNHFTAVKPDTVHHPSHTFLVDFWAAFRAQAERFAPEGRGSAATASARPQRHASPPVRVSMAVLLCLRMEGKYLLVRNLHRPELFAPLGGVYKYRESAIPALADFGFAPEGYETRTGLDADLERDLRGFLAPQNLGRFRGWFARATDRETLDCLTRELKEELEEAGVDPALVEAAQRMTFVPIRTISEGPEPTPYGHDQFRTLDIYEPELRDPARCAAVLDVMRRLFEAAAGNARLLVVDHQMIERLRSGQGQPLAPTVDYFFGSSRRMYEPVPFGHGATVRGIQKEFTEFIASRGCELFKRSTVIGEPQFLHGVRKGYSESLVAKIACDGLPYIVKFYSKADIYVRKELWAIAELRNRGLNVPRVLESSLQAPTFILMEYISGRQLLDCLKEDLDSHIRGTVRAVERFRAITFGHYGEVVGEFSPIGNHDSLCAYVRASVGYYLNELEKGSGSRLRPSASHSGELIRWAEFILATPAGVSLSFESNLSAGPCLCHSDVKLTDVLVRESERHNEYFIIDFDNVYSFVPEFDLCKLHFSLLQFDIEFELDAFAQIVGSIYGVPAHRALAGLRSVYPLMLLRLLAWGVRRNHELLVMQVARAARRLSLTPE